METLKCFCCDIVINVEKIFVGKDKLPPEVELHIQTETHIFKQNIKTVAAKTMRAIIEVTPELNSPSIVKFWESSLK